MDASTLDQGELLFARLSMEDFLQGRGPSKWDFRDPNRIADEISDGFKSYLRSGAGPPVKVDTSWAFAIPDMIPESAFASAERLPDDVIIPFSMVAQRALQYMLDLVPKRMLSGLASREATTNHAERARMRRAAAMLEDPVGVLASPEFVSQDAVNALAAVYPSLYEAVVIMVGEAIQGLSGPLRSREEVAFSRIIGAPVRAIAALQGPDVTRAGADPNPRRPRGKPPADPELGTPTQRISNA